jgi:hypothetical protein
MGPESSSANKAGSEFKLMGIKISPASIKEGTKSLNELGFENITLIERWRQMI